ncbi:MAG: hypothetical protein MI747_08635, partial [Desulfobacterales bacterium]|nr:hypothetical protein [Desulfobacterales bacterium]
DFKVISGGTLGQGGDKNKPIVLEYKSTVTSGRIEINPGEMPARVKVDGMLLVFNRGTLTHGDHFTIKTDDSGRVIPKDSQGIGRPETGAQWHWTLDSFAAQLNRKSPGVEARVTPDNRLVIQPRDYYSPENMSYSGKNGFAKDNTEFAVKNWSALNMKATDLQLVRSGGRWSLANDPTGGRAKLLPPGGNDNGFAVDMDGDGVGDIEVKFKKKVSGDGSIEFDLVKHPAKDTAFAFGDNGGDGPGLLAALGINTFFQGSNAGDMETNETLKDIRYLATGRVNSKTGEINAGDNANAKALAGAQDNSTQMRQWYFSRGNPPTSKPIEAGLDEYHSTLVGSLGITARGVKNSVLHADGMVKNLTQQRNAVSAVSLDEEMIRMMKFQHAYNAASKLLKTTDEMMKTLLSSR